MAKEARGTAGLRHHVTQQGNRRQTVFFSEADYRLYRDLLARSAATACVEVWAWCLMPNHVHLILVPATPDGLVRALQETHRRYTRCVNAREGWHGCLRQGCAGGPGIGKASSPRRASGSVCGCA